MKRNLANVARWLTLAVLFLQHGLVSGQTLAATWQTNRNTGIPPRLRASFDDRLRRFIQAQASGDWDSVSIFLGRFRGGTRGASYTQAHKECLISQMRSLPMVSFAVEEVSFSTEILSTPASQRWWYLMGTVEYMTQSTAAKARAAIIAFRDRGERYFTPPSYDDSWVRTRVTEADLSADRSANVDLQLDPECPLELRDLTVAMDRDNLSSRRIRFNLVNKTDKKVTGYSLRLGRVDSPCYGYISGRPLDLDPKTEAVGEEVTYSAYTYFCEGETKRRLVIDSVSFLDGSTWTDPRFRGKRPAKGCLF